MNRFSLKLIFGAIYLCISAQVNAQRNPLGSQYFINPYLIDPAMAGIEQGLKLNAAFRRQKAASAGGPVTQNITAEYGFKKAEIGINLNNDRAGLLTETRAMTTFAYHLPLDGADQLLHFGVSVGLRSQRISLDDLNGNVDDVLLGQYNQRQNYLDGDFGTAYTSGSLAFQVTVFNLKHFFRKDMIEIDHRETFFTAVSYKVYLSDAASSELTPLLAYRGMDRADHVWDAGAQLSLSSRQVLFTAIYHTNDIATFGLGVNYLGKYLINGIYHINTSGLNENNTGSFEIGFGMKL
jgi:type IX secretion system PorP/SprF family membrane protein